MFVWVFLGGVAWFAICKLGLKKGTIMGIGITGRGLSFPDAMWAAWSCMVSGSNHTKEVHAPGRIVAITVALGGLLSYSVMTGAISAAIKQTISEFEAAASGPGEPDVVPVDVVAERRGGALCMLCVLRSIASMLATSQPSSARSDRVAKEKVAPAARALRPRATAKA